MAAMRDAGDIGDDKVQVISHKGSDDLTRNVKSLTTTRGLRRLLQPRTTAISTQMHYLHSLPLLLRK
eukprot:12900673-Prorocentrum_lima.AAC.1